MPKPKPPSPAEVARKKAQEALPGLKAKLDAMLSKQTVTPSEGDQEVDTGDEGKDGSDNQHREDEEVDAIPKTDLEQEGDAGVVPDLEEAGAGQEEELEQKKGKKKKQKKKKEDEAEAEEEEEDEDEEEVEEEEEEGEGEGKEEDVTDDEQEWDEEEPHEDTEEDVWTMLARTDASLPELDQIEIQGVLQVTEPLVRETYTTYNEVSTGSSSCRFTEVDS